MDRTLEIATSSNVFQTSHCFPGSNLASVRIPPLPMAGLLNELHFLPSQWHTGPGPQPGLWKVSIPSSSFSLCFYRQSFLCQEHRTSPIGLSTFLNSSVYLSANCCSQVFDIMWAACYTNTTCYYLRESIVCFIQPSKEQNLTYTKI